MSLTVDYQEQAKWITPNMNLKGLSGQNNFCLFFSEKFLTDLKTNFTKFELSTIASLQDITI